MALPAMKETLNTNPKCKATVAAKAAGGALCQRHVCCREIHRAPWHMCECGMPFHLPKVLREVS